MKKDKVYLTFSTDRNISELLQLIATGLGKTQPQLIEEICINYVNEINEICAEELRKKGIPFTEEESIIN